MGADASEWGAAMVLDAALRAAVGPRASEHVPAAAKAWTAARSKAW